MASQIPFDSLDPSSPDPNPEYILEYVKQNAHKGDPNSVLGTVEEYCSKYAWRSMHVGSCKGGIVEEIIRECNPTIAVELGGFFGYSAVKFSRLLEPGAKFYSIEVNAEYASLVSQMVDFAGLRDRVTVINGSSESTIPVLREKFGIDHVDFMFLDHWKALYKPDLIRLVECGLLKKGSVIAADNVIYPGAPEYLEYVRSSPLFESTFYESRMDYRKDVRDGIEKSIFIG